MKRTLKKELKVLEIVYRETFKIWAILYEIGGHVVQLDETCYYLCSFMIIKIVLHDYLLLYK